MLSTPGNTNLEKKFDNRFSKLILHPLTPPRQILTEWRDLFMVELYTRPVPDRFVHGIDFLTKKQSRHRDKKEKLISQQIRVSYAQPIDAKWRPPASGGISIGRPVQCKENFAVRSRLSIEVANKKGRSSRPYCHRYRKFQSIPRDVCGQQSEQSKRKFQSTPVLYSLLPSASQLEQPVKSLSFHSAP